MKYYQILKIGWVTEFSHHRISELVNNQISKLFDFFESLFAHLVVDL